MEYNFNIDNNAFIRVLKEYIEKFNEASKNFAKAVVFTKNGKYCTPTWTRYITEKIELEDIIKSLYGVMHGNEYVLVYDEIEDEWIDWRGKTHAIKYGVYSLTYNYENEIIEDYFF